MDATHATQLIAPVDETGSAAVRPDDPAQVKRAGWPRSTSRPVARLTANTERAVADDLDCDMDDVDVRVVRRDGRLTVSVSGDLDMGTAPILTAVVDRHLRASAPKALEFDLGQVTFMDCAGISALLRYSRRGADPGCTVTLTHVPTRVRRLIGLAGLTPYFRIDSSDSYREPGPATSTGTAA